MSRNKIISNRLFPGDNGLSLKRSSVAALATTLAVHLLGKPAFCNARRAALAVKYWKGLKINLWCGLSTCVSRDSMPFVLAV